MNYKELIIECYSVSDFCRKIGFTTNGRDIKRAKNIIIDESLDISHFDIYSSRKLYINLEKICPVCKNIFNTKNNKKEKITCSRSCSNTHFRSGENNANYKDIDSYNLNRTNSLIKKYRELCFSKHKKECIVCNENKIVEVHHLDGDKFNNNVDNLMPLCPTHHQYWHSRYRSEIESIVLEYRDEFIKNNIK